MDFLTFFLLPPVLEDELLEEETEDDEDTDDETAEEEDLEELDVTLTADLGAALFVWIMLNRFSKGDISFCFWFLLLMGVTMAIGVTTDTVA